MFIYAPLLLLLASGLYRYLLQRVTFVYRSASYYYLWGQDEEISYCGMSYLIHEKDLDMMLRTLVSTFSFV